MQIVEKQSDHEDVSLLEENGWVEVTICAHHSDQFVRVRRNHLTLLHCSNLEPLSGPVALYFFVQCLIRIGGKFLVKFAVLICSELLNLQKLGPNYLPHAIFKLGPAEQSLKDPHLAIIVEFLAT